MANNINNNLGKPEDNIGYQEAVAKAQNPGGIAITDSIGKPTGETRDATAADAKLNTGAGTVAPTDVKYSWDTKAINKAQTQYQTDVLNQKQQSLANRQTLENNAVNYQAQSDMLKYQNNQSAEKVGWTGGYVLDQNRQSEYLKASIQAQMYGAMELQKYGYESALAAARLSYDLNQQEYAQKYYQDAVNSALSEAQLTGTYFSAETKDMMGQLTIARQKENDQNLSIDERKKAADLKKQIISWFSDNDISENGVKTLEAWQADQSLQLQWSNELWTRYESALKATKTDISTNNTAFIMVDSEGNPVYNGTTIDTIDFSTSGIDSVEKYVVDEDNVNEKAKEQLFSYFDYVINDAIASYKQSVMTQDGEETKYNVTEVGLNRALNKAYNKLKEYTESEGKFKEIIDAYSFTSTDPSFNNLTDKSLVSLKGKGIEDGGGGPTVQGEVFDTFIAGDKNIKYYNQGLESKEGTRNDVFNKELSELNKTSIKDGSYVILTNIHKDHVFLYKKDGNYYSYTPEQIKENLNPDNTTVFFSGFINNNGTISFGDYPIKNTSLKDVCKPIKEVHIPELDKTFLNDAQKKESVLNHLKTTVKDLFGFELPGLDELADELLKN